MTEKDKVEFRLMLTDVVNVLAAELNGKLDLINNEVGHIKVQTTLTNGRVTKLEEKTQTLRENEIDHLARCPNMVRIQTLENNETSRNGVFRFVKIATGVIATLATIIIAWLELKTKS